jgi:photosystem II stability/assembly factor-like uncharacterized protein
MNHLPVIAGVAGIVLVSIALAGYVLAACGSATTKDAAHSDTTAATSLSAALSADLSCVDFVDSAHGWAAGSKGAILATSNGGKTWRAQRSGTASWLRGVAFADVAHGWAVGDDGTILTTSDGGATWTRQRSGTRVSLLAVSFVDPLHGWAIAYDGPPHIIATADGGKTWRAQKLGFPYLESVVFLNRDRGWALGDFGSIFATTNGGQSWRQQHLAGRRWPAETSASLARAVDSLGLSFADPAHGWLVSDWGTIQATTDGGATWHVQRQGAAYGLSLNGVSFASALHGWVVGDQGTILATSNGGKTWRAQTSGTGQNLNSVDFVDASHGWAVGDHGTILVTSDDGATWHSQGSRLAAFSSADSR